MSSSHLCYDHPDGKAWVDGPASRCEFHRRNRNAPRVREGRSIRRKKDRAAGVVGHDSGYGFFRDGPG